MIQIEGMMSKSVIAPIGLNWEIVENPFRQSPKLNTLSGF
jgi:hypothetical protein